MIKPILAALLLLLAPGLLPAAPADRGIFGSTLPAAEIQQRLADAGIPLARRPLFSASHYVLLRKADLGTFTAKVRNHLYKFYGPRWDERFNCLAFARHLASQADLLLAVEDWHAPVPRHKRDSVVSVRPAVLVVCYLKGGIVDPARTNGHAVNLILTDEGPVWYDPQIGAIPAPTDTELATVYYPQF